MPGKLFVVATPIGNLEDMAPRAVRVLGEAGFIAAEDTRHTGHLLAHFGIRKPMISYHQFSEAKRTAEFLRRFEEGQSIALVSDAGLPGLSDPGERLIRAAVEAGVPVEIVPGPSAPLLALAGSGFPMVPFYFGGFLPVKSGQRRKELLAAAARDCTSVYFESPYRVVRLLEDAVAEIPQARLCLARELTKKFEEYRRGTAAELLEHFKKHEPRGEFCFVIASADHRQGKKTGEAECEIERRVEEIKSGLEKGIPAGRAMKEARQAVAVNEVRRGSTKPTPQTPREGRSA